MTFHSPRPLIVTLIVLFSLSVAAQQPTRVSKPATVSPVPSPLQQFEQYIAYWTTEAGWNTELQLRNNLESADLTVTPALRTADGTETALPPVTIKPGDVVSLDFSDLFTKTATKLLGFYGSIVLRYRAPVERALFASAMIRVQGQPIAFHLDAEFEALVPRKASTEGLWWLPRESVTDFLVLTNSSEQSLNTILTIYNSAGEGWSEPLLLAPRQTQRLSVGTLLRQSQLNDFYGGFRVSTAGYLHTAHLLFDEQGGFGALLKSFYHDPEVLLSTHLFGGVKEWTTRAPMLALTNPDPALRFPAGTVLQPKVFIRNSSATPYTAQIRFEWRSAAATGKTVPINIALKPNATRVVDVASLQSQNLIPSDAYWAAVILSAPVQPNDLMAIASSYDHTLRYGVQTPFSDQLASHWEGSKWEVDSMHDSLVAVGNGGNKPAQAELTLLYNQGKGQYRVVQPLAPDEQMFVDFGKLIQGQIPDEDGSVLPPDLTYGVYRIRDLADPAGGGLYEGKITLDKTNGHAAYGCGICCGNEFPLAEYDPINAIIELYEIQQYNSVNSCGGGTVNVTAYFPTWWTGSSSIATANLNKITGVGVGSTTTYAKSEDTYWASKGIPDGQCPETQIQVQAPTNVGPEITGISPAQGLVGVAIGVTISGKGFASGATVSAGSNISVSSVSVVNSTTITATFTPTNSGSAGGNQAVTVTVSGFPASNPVNFFDQVPTHLGYIDEPSTPNDGHSSITSGTSITIINVSGTTLATGVCGGYQWITYGLADQNTNQIKNGTVTFTESFSNISPSPDPFGNPVPGTPSSPNLASQVLGDTYAIYNTAPPACPPPSVGDSFNQQWTATVGTVVYPLTTVISISRSTNSQGLPTFTSSITTP